MRISLLTLVAAGAAIATMSNGANAHPAGAARTTATPAAIVRVADTTTFKVGDLVIETPWTRQPPNGARVAGGFMKITNTGKAADKLIGGSASFAKRFEVHEMAMADGVMRMRELSTGLEIKPGETVELKPGGYHVMFMDMTDTPVAGAPRKITLKFEKAGDIAIDLAVVPMGGTPGAASGGHHKH